MSRTFPHPEHIVQSNGMGVQSNTIMRLDELGLIVLDGKVAHAECGIFSNTQQEPSSVERWIKIVQPTIKIPLYVETRGDLGADGLVVNRSKKSGKLYQKNLIPLFIKNPDGSRGILQRKCTSEYKIRVIYKKLRELWPEEYRQWRKMFKKELAALAAHKRDMLHYRLALRHYRITHGRPPAVGVIRAPSFPSAEWETMQVNALVVSWVGISTDEADRQKPSREPWIRTRYPLIEMGWSRQMCIDWYMEKYGVRPPRSACKFCPYHSDEEWIRLKLEEPEDFAEAVAYEKAIQGANQRDEVTKGVPYLHDSLVPLDQVVFANRPDKFGEECGGVCGVDL